VRLLTWPTNLTNYLSKLLRNTFNSLSILLKHCKITNFWSVQYFRTFVKYFATLVSNLASPTQFFIIINWQNGRLVYKTILYPHVLIGRGNFAGLRVTKRNKATVLLTLTLFQTPTLTPNPNPYPNLTLLQVCF
jgi:hypothetical protein